MAYEDIKVTVEDGIGLLTIDRGDGRNPLRPQSLGEICAGLDELTADPSARAIVFAATGDHFSAGADFKFLSALTTTPGPQIRDQVYTVFQGAAKRLWNCTKPVVAAIQGSAITVGCELALACDFRIGTPTTKLQESWIRLGLMPPLGGLFLLPRLVGFGRAADIVLTGRPVAADEALQIGLVNRIVPNEDLRATAIAQAKELAALPPLAYRAVKEALHRGLESSMEKEWATNVLSQTLLLGSDDFKEGLASVLERRPGQFKGA